MDPVLMFERAASAAADAIGRVGADQRTVATPCTEWDVEALIGHMAGGPAYLLAALGMEPTTPPTTDEASYRAAVATCIAALREPGAIDRRCMSPAGFEWSVAEAAAGT